MGDDQKEVYFDQYCKACKYEKLDESEYPCGDCLNNPANTYSYKPVKYEER